MRSVHHNQNNNPNHSNYNTNMGDDIIIIITTIKRSPRAIRSSAAAALQLHAVNLADTGVGVYIHTYVFVRITVAAAVTPPPSPVLFLTIILLLSSPRPSRRCSPNWRSILITWNSNEICILNFTCVVEFLNADNVQVFLKSK